MFQKYQWLICGLLLPIVFLSNAAQNTPLKPSQHIAQQLITALNSHNYHDILSFAQTHISQSRLERMGGASRYADYLAAESFFHGQLDFESIQLVEVEDGLVLTNVYVTSKNTELRYFLALSVTDSTPAKMTRLRFRPAPTTQVADKVDEAKAIAAFSSYIDTISASDTFSGTVLVAKGTDVLLEKATGLASKRFNSKNNLDTRFNLGSMNKMFTSVIILRLIEQGKLKLSSSLEEVLGVKGKAEGFSDIQIQHLLSHTSGIGRVSCEMGETSISRSKDACLQKLANTSVNFAPGSAYRYSGDGMYTLGLVIEKLTNKSYDQILQQELLDKANMQGTACLDLQFPVSNAAIGYTYNAHRSSWQNNLFIHDKKGGPAGGCYASARDLYKFSIALQSNQLLSQEMTHKALTAKTEFGAQNYGFGFVTRQRNQQTVVGHNGSFPGVSSRMNMYLDSGYTIVVLSNHSFADGPVVEKFNQLFGL